MNISKETALISGINGFIGQHLKKALEQREIETIGIWREILLSPSALSSFIQLHNPQYIFHLAAYGNHGTQKEEEQTIITNFNGTYTLLLESKYIPYKVFVNIATSSMYGKKDSAMNETDCYMPDTFYAATKAGAAYLARAYAMQYDKPIVNIVPFSVFGEGEADWRFIPTVCRHLVTGETMPFVSKPTHDWIYIDNFIDGLLTVADHADKLKGEAVNIGMGQLIANHQIVRLLEKISGKKLKTEENYQEQPHHSPFWVADNKKLMSLGWKPRVSLYEGLERTWRYYRDKYEK